MLQIMLNFAPRIAILFMAISVALGATCNAKLTWNCGELHTFTSKFSGGDVSDCGTFYPKSKFEVLFRIDYELYDETKRYTMIMVDPDAPGSEAGKGWLHLIKAGIQGRDLAPGLPVNENYSSTDVTPYGKPTPPKNTGVHRYFIFLYEEQGGSPSEEISQRRNFDIQEYATLHNLCGPVAMSMFTTEF
ncbi:protein D2-like [Macrobrachium nipponense]|uniref:protein D2-like n=1 Tax=Macrobrachium nipponense TaxID=159736 RepID=UPI0030C8BB2E